MSSNLCPLGVIEPDWPNMTSTDLLTDGVGGGSLLHSATRGADCKFLTVAPLEPDCPRGGWRCFGVVQPARRHRARQARSIFSRSYAVGHGGTCLLPGIT